MLDVSEGSDPAPGLKLDFLVVDLHKCKHGGETSCCKKGNEEISNTKFHNSRTFQIKTIIDVTIMLSLNKKCYIF